MHALDSVIAGTQLAQLLQFQLFKLETGQLFVCCILLDTYTLAAGLAASRECMGHRAQSNTNSHISSQDKVIDKMDFTPGKHPQAASGCRHCSIHSYSCEQLG